MLQIIGWMLCGYMVLKAFELILIGRTAPEEGRSSSMAIAMVGAVLALLMVFIFGAMLNEQGRASALPSSFSSPSLP